jgi:hypothetical protein
MTPVQSVDAPRYPIGRVTIAEKVKTGEKSETTCGSGWLVFRSIDLNLLTPGFEIWKSEPRSLYVEH